MAGDGEVRVDVEPDASTFAAKANRDLAKASRKIKDVEVEVTAKVRQRDSRGRFTKGDGAGAGVPGEDDERRTNLFTKAVRGASSGVRGLIGALGSLTTVTHGAQIALIALLAVVLAGPAAFAVALGAALALVGGFATLGLVAAAQSEKIQKQFGKLGEAIKDIFTDAAKPLEPVLSKLIDNTGKTLGKLKPVFSRIFESLAPVIQSFGDNVLKSFDTFIRAMEPTLKALEPAFTAFGEQLPGLAADIATSLQMITQSIADNPEMVADFVKGLGTAFIALGQLFIELQKLNEALGFGLPEALVFAIGSIIFGITVITTLVNAIKTAVLWVGENFPAAWNAVAGAMAAAWAIISGIASAGFAFLVARGQAFLAAIQAIFATFRRSAEAVFNAFIAAGRRAAAGISAAVGLISAAFNRARSAVSGAINGLIGLVRSIPGRIRGALGGLGGLLVGAGRALINGLISGINGALGRLRSAVSRAAGIVRNFWPFSPAKEGPLSGSGSMDIAGRNIGEMLASGISQSRSVVAAATSGLAGTVTSGTASPTGGVRVHSPSTAEGQRMVLEIRADDNRMSQLLVEVLSKAVRIRGGNVQTVLGTRGAAA